VQVAVRRVEFAASACRTRLPFRFGMATLTEAPLAVARVVAEVDGAESVGHSGDLLVPKWFEKDPAKSAGDDVRALAASMRRAKDAFLSVRGSVFGCWRSAYRTCVETGGSGVSLVDGFGVALVERALIDAACRAAGEPFASALGSGALGFDAGALHPEAAGLPPDRVVRHPPLDRVALRHTVGLADALRSSEVPDELRGSDGHPVALEEDVARYRPRFFKLKLSGDPETDRARLVEVARVVAEAEVPRPRFTLDANEQYRDLASLGALLDRLAGDRDARSLMDGLIYIEQPLPRDESLSPGVAGAVRALSRTAPVILDEADAGLDAFPRALALGYRGVSVKNCKGVFRAFANRALCVVRGDGSFQASEDLTNLPVLPLQQDLATVAALGLPHAERNGHHYFAGLEPVPAAEAEGALAAHPDLYERAGDRIRLRIRDGSLALGSLQQPGYGYAGPIAFGERTPFDSFDWEGSG